MGQSPKAGAGWGNSVGGMGARGVFRDGMGKVHPAAETHPDWLPACPAARLSAGSPAAWFIRATVRRMDRSLWQTTFAPDRSLPAQSDLIRCWSAAAAGLAGPRKIYCASSVAPHLRRDEPPRFVRMKGLEIDLAL
jgi:hypothetical protein